MTAISLAVITALLGPHFYISAEEYQLSVTKSVTTLKNLGVRVERAFELEGRRPFCLYVSAGFHSCSYFDPVVSIDAAGRDISARDAVSEFRYLCNVRSLYISYNPLINDTIGSSIASMRNLVYLGMSETGITDQCLKEISDLKNLHELDIHGTRISDVGLLHVARMNSIKRLGLANTRIGDRAARYIAGMPAIEYLDMSGTDLTDDGLMAMKACKSLRGVCVTDARVTKAGILKLQAVAPWIRAFGVFDGQDF